MTRNLTITETVESLTGWDETAIEKHFGADFDSLRTSASLRALVFILQVRDGKTAREAYQFAMDLPLKSLNDHFADEPDEPFEEQPETEVGKGASADA